MLKVNAKHRITLILCFGLLLSGAIFAFIHSWELSRFAKEFEYSVSSYAIAVQKELESVEKTVADVRFLIEHDINIEHDNPQEPEDFMPMAERLLIDDPQLLNIAWGVFESTATKAESLNVIYAKKGNHSSLIHKDFVYLDDSHAGITYLPQQGRLIQVQVERDKHSHVNALNFIAAVSSQMQTGALLATTQIGAVITVWDIEGLIERALDGLPTASQQISLFLIDGDRKELVYSSSGHSHDSTDLYHEVSFSFSGQNGQLNFTATPQYLKDHPTVLAWQSLALSLFLTCFIVWGMQRSRKNFMLIEEEVIARTAELEASQQALLTSNQRYSTLVEMSHMGILVQQRGTLLYANPYIAEKLGFADQADHLIGRNILEFIHPKDQFTVAERIEDMLKNSTNYLHTDECYIYPPEGIMYSDTSSVCIDYEGQSAVLMVIQDVSQRHLTESKLQHIDRVESLGVLAGGIAHDFNNLLSAILAHASLMQSQPDTSMHARKRSSVDAIIDACHTAAGLCNQMLAYSGKGQFIIAPVNLSQVAKDMGNLIDVAVAKQVTINYQLSQSLPAIDADISQIQQVLLNLITNASEAIDVHGERSEVKLCTIKTGEMQVDDEFLSDYFGYQYLEETRYVYLEVSDTGCGMDKETKLKIFDPYYSTKFTGRGLGMSALLGIVKGHHGGIRINSTLGLGTVITVVLPISSHVVTKPKEVMKKAPEPHHRFNGTALVIDDELIVRTSATLMLEELGFEVMTSNDGVEGVELFSKYKDQISLVLLDLTMPNMGGEECFYELKRIRTDINVILSSGYSVKDVTEKFVDAGLAGFIQKPYSLDDLEEKILQTQ